MHLFLLLSITASHQAGLWSCARTPLVKTGPSLRCGFKCSAKDIRNPNAFAMVFNRSPKMLPLTVAVSSLSSLAYALYLLSSLLLLSQTSAQRPLFWSPVWYQILAWITSAWLPDISSKATLLVGPYITVLLKWHFFISPLSLSCFFFNLYGTYHCWNFSF